MRKKFILILFFFPLITQAQNPLVKIWDKRFGGDTAEYLSCFLQTKDGGYLLGGYSSSGISGDKTQALWDTSATIVNKGDYWIVKIDSSGNKEWDKDFGGTDWDVMNSFEQTSDGGYILGGSTRSQTSGDKTQLLWGGSDYWIIKLDSLGNKEWDRDIGGGADENLCSVRQTKDKGYILGGSSYSGMSGQKTQPSHGDYDYWIVKLDSMGIIQWDKDLGGTSSDFLNSIEVTYDGGYILCGWSFSGIGGDKSGYSNGGDDFWIIKVDSMGMKQWDKDFGSGYTEWFDVGIQTRDSGYVIGGSTNSPSGGTTWDFWAMKIKANGDADWIKIYGGLDDDELQHIEQTNDGGFLITGDSYSPLSGNKTEDNMGQEQTWILKTDSLGDIEWDKTILTPGHDETGIGVQSKDGCFVFANWSNAGIGGYKSQASRGDWDYWVIKFCDSTLATDITPDEIENGGMQVYPNPVESQFTMQNAQFTMGAALDISINNSLGEIVLVAHVQTANCALPTELDVHTLLPGIYFLQVSGNEKTFHTKFIKQ